MALVDASDGEDVAGVGVLPGQPAERGRSERRAPGAFRGRVEDRAEDDEVGAPGDGGGGLLRSVRRRRRCGSPGACSTGRGPGEGRRPEGGRRPRPAASAMSNRRFTYSGTAGPRTRRASRARASASRSGEPFSRSCTARPGHSASAAEHVRESLVADRGPVRHVERLHSPPAGPADSPFSARERPRRSAAPAARCTSPEPGDEAAKEARAEQARQRNSSRPRAQQQVDPHRGAVEDEDGIPQKRENAAHLEGFYDGSREATGRPQKSTAPEGAVWEEETSGRSQGRPGRPELEGGAPREGGAAGAGAERGAGAAWAGGAGAARGAGAGARSTDRGEPPRDCGAE